MRNDTLNSKIFLFTNQTGNGTSETHAVDGKYAVSFQKDFGASTLTLYVNGVAMTNGVFTSASDKDFNFETRGQVHGVVTGADGSTDLTVSLLRISD